MKKIHGKSAIDLKNLGNEYYKRRKYLNALNCYLEAQNQDSSNSVYLLNMSAGMFIKFIIKIIIIKKL